MLRPSRAHCGFAAAAEASAAASPAASAARRAASVGVVLRRVSACRLRSMVYIAGPAPAPRPDLVGRAARGLEQIGAAIGRREPR